MINVLFSFFPDSKCFFHGFSFERVLEAMPDKRKFSSDLIDSLTPPQKGEKWISDIELPGFGVRLWGGKTKGKSFAIRVNVNGKIKRKALIEAKGEYLDWIRRYVETEIEKLKEDRISDSVMNKFLSISFEELAKSAIENQRKTTNSEKYVDDNWSRFSTYTPQYMKDMRALDIEPCDLSHVLSSINKKDSQRKNLRSLYNYICSWAYKKTKNAEFLRIVYRLRDEEIEIYQPKCYLFDNSIEILKERDFDSLFDILKKEKKHRQKADFILLMFHLRAGAKPIKLLRAKWDEFLFLKLQNGKTEYVWCPKRNTEKSAMLGRCKLDKTVYNLLIDIKQRNNKKFLESDFVFPSNKSWITGHMATQQSGFGQV